MQANRVACRAQDPPAEPSPSQIAEVQHSRFALGNLWRSRMIRSSTTTAEPRKHCALGIGSYCQVTSPIRRCAPPLSLLAQMQGTCRQLH